MSLDSSSASAVLAVLTQDSSLLAVARRAAARASLSVRALESSRLFLKSFEEDGLRLGLIDLQASLEDTPALLESVAGHAARARLILTAPDPALARRCGAQVGGVVHHVFTEPPSSEILAAFLDVARRRAAEPV